MDPEQTTGKIVADPQGHKVRRVPQRRSIQSGLTDYIQVPPPGVLCRFRCSQSVPLHPNTRPVLLRPLRSSRSRRFETVANTSSDKHFIASGPGRG